MRIKKYQKIICLGLALLSIMVLPCYADEEIIVFSYDSNREYRTRLEMYYDPTVFNYLVNQNIITGYNYIGSYYNEDSSPYYQINSNKQNLTILSYSNGISNQVLYDSWDEPRNAVSSVNYGVVDLGETTVRVKVYNIKLNNSDFNGIYTINLYRVVIPNEQEFIMDNIMILSPVNEAVINITTYTNLLIQNFEKAFTFMTGPALPWVLLGITVSLITFGIHTSKRII